jgi:hypothetical protein
MGMYKDNLVVVVKHKGKVLREVGDCVYLPFNSEYSLLIKNFNLKKASVSVYIDGDDVLNGKSLLIQSESRTELKGFLDGKTAKNKFRFIEKTKQISDYRGDRVDDGLIRVKFAFEKDQPEFIYYPPPPPRRPCPWEPFGPIKYCTSSPLYNDSFIDNDTTGCASFTCSNSDVEASNTKRKIGKNSIIADDAVGMVTKRSAVADGITVKGSEINQNFDYGYVGELGRSRVMIIRLCGERDNGTIIEKPRLVSTRLTCPTCGKRSRSDSKFCGRCGTFLK